LKACFCGDFSAQQRVDRIHAAFAAVPEEMKEFAYTLSRVARVHSAKQRDWIAQWKWQSVAVVLLNGGAKNGFRSATKRGDRASSVVGLEPVIVTAPAKVRATCIIERLVEVLDLRQITSCRDVSDTRVPVGKVRADVGCPIVREVV